MSLRRLPRALGALALVAIASGCFRTPGTTVEGPEAPPVRLRVTEAKLPAASTSSLVRGTQLTLRLEERVSNWSARGQSVTARVENDVHAPDGSLVIARGARVVGTVAEARVGRAPLLALDFLSVETANGSASISAKLAGADRVHLLDTGEVYDPQSSRYDAFFSAWYVAGPLGLAGPAAGTFNEDYYDEHDKRIELPAGARLRLELTKPLDPTAPTELETHGDTRRTPAGPIEPWGTPPITGGAPADDGTREMDGGK